MAKLKDLVVAIGANTTDFDKKIGKSMHKIKAFGKNTKRVGKDLTMRLTAPIAALGGIAVKTAASFELSMAKVQAVSGFAANEISRLESQAKSLGGSTSKSASEVAGLQLELAKLGKTSGEIEAMTESILSLSVAFDTDLAEASRVVGESLNQFGLGASESSRVADNMAVLFGSSALDLEKFGSAMSVVGPTASAMGLSIEQAGAALGTLVNAGVDASTAGTSLTKALTTLAAEGMSGDEALTSLFNGTLSVADGFEIFGDRAGKIIPILQKSGDAYGTLIQKQNEGTGAALAARKVLEDTAQGGFDRLNSSVEALGITVGNALIPFVNKAANFISDLASGMSNMNSSSLSLVGSIAAVAAAIGPLLMVLPMLVQGLMLIVSPAGLIIAALIAIVTAVYKFSSEVSKPIAAVANYFIKLYNEITFVRAIIGALKGVVQTVFDFFGFAIDSVIGAFKDLGAIIHAIFSGNFSEIPGLVKDAFENAANRAIEFGKKAGENIIEGITNELERDPLELVTPESVQNAIDTMGGLKTYIDGLMSGGGGGGTATAAPTGPADMQEMAATTGANALAGMSGNEATGGLIGIEHYANRVKIATKVHNDAIDESERRDQSYIASVQQLAGTLQSSFSNLFTGLMDGTQSFGEFMKQVLKDLLIKMASMAAAFLLISALIPGGGAALGGFGGFMKSGFGLTGFADGGIVSGPTAALVGEYSGARTNPEVIAPLDKLQSMIQGAGGGNVTVTGRISGRDILLSNERSAFERNRVRGF